MMATSKITSCALLSFINHLTHSQNWSDGLGVVHSAHKQCKHTCATHIFTYNWFIFSSICNENLITPLFYWNGMLNKWPTLYYTIIMIHIRTSSFPKNLENCGLVRCFLAHSYMDAAVCAAFFMCWEIAYAYNKLNNSCSQLQFALCTNRIRNVTNNNWNALDGCCACWMCWLCWMKSGNRIVECRRL